MDLFRRCAISDSTTTAEALRTIQQQAVATQPGSMELLTALGKTVLAVGSTTAGATSVGHDDVANQANITLQRINRLLPPIDFKDDAALAMIDEYALRKLEELVPQVVPLLLETLPLPEHLPFLEHVAGLLRFKRQLPEESVVLGCQHLMGTTIAQFHQLHALGIRYEDMFILGKPYSANRAVVLKMKSRGMNVSDSTLQFPPQAAKNARGYDTFMKRAARELATRALDRAIAMGSRATLLVIDDGGLLIDTVHELTTDHAEQLPRIVGVEQTTGGLIKLHGRRLMWPVVNVAHSHAKLTFESPFIAESINCELEARVRRLRGIDDLSGLAITVIGYGAVGAAVAVLLKQAESNVTVYDKDAKKVSAASGHFRTTPTLAEALRGADAVIGCTGERWLKWPDVSAWLAPEAVLGSASSADIEFRGLRGRARGTYRWAWNAFLEEDSDFQRAHNDYVVPGDRGRVWLANGGFPVNFTGGIDPIPPLMIQLTRALMFAGSVQALTTPKGRGLVELDQKIETIIRRKALATEIGDRLREMGFTR